MLADLNHFDPLLKVVARCSLNVTGAGANLDIALTIIAQAEKVSLELRALFAYLNDISNQVRGSTISGFGRSKKTKTGEVVSAGFREPNIRIAIMLLDIAVNTVRIDINGNMIDLTVNGAYLTSVIESSLPGCRTGASRSGALRARRRSTSIWTYCRN